LIAGIERRFDVSSLRSDDGAVTTARLQLEPSDQCSAPIPSQRRKVVSRRCRKPLLYPLSYGGSRASVAPAANTLACSSESRSPAGCRTLALTPGHGFKAQHSLAPSFGCLRGELMFLLEDESSKAEKPATRLTRTTTRFPAACAPAGNRGQCGGSSARRVEMFVPRPGLAYCGMHRIDWDALGP
jgi:hypothetical protein